MDEKENGSIVAFCSDEIRLGLNATAVSVVGTWSETAWDQLELRGE